MNNCSFIGRIGKDAVVRNTGTGKSVAGWSLAVDIGYGDNKQTMWIDCALWGDRAHKLAEHIRKGDRIGVHGEIGTREHDGKTYITLRVSDVTLLGDKRDQGSQRSEPARQRAPAQQQQSQPVSDFDDDSIPF